MGEGQFGFGVKGLVFALLPIVEVFFELEVVEFCFFVPVAEFGFGGEPIQHIVVMHQLYFMLWNMI